VAIILLFLILLVVGGIAALFFGIRKALANSDAYRMSVDRAHASACVVSKLGEPLAPSGLPSGNINEENGEGTADLTITLKGSRGSGSLHTIASRDGGVWSITALTLDPTDGNEIQLLPVPSPCQ
jgi:hypothetical protein